MSKRFNVHQKDTKQCCPRNQEGSYPAPQVAQRQETQPDTTEGTGSELDPDRWLISKPVKVQCLLYASEPNIAGGTPFLGTDPPSKTEAVFRKREQTSVDSQAMHQIK